MIELLEGRYFKTFIAVMEEKSFSRAADKLGYVQSTVTTHIQFLEQACKQKLFHRLSRGVKPTAAGEKLVKFAYQFVHLGASIEEAMNEIEQPRGTVYLRMQESFFLTRISSIMQHFVKEYPEVKLRVESGFHQDILDQVLEHAIDFGIVPRDPQRNDLIFYPLVEEKLVFIASHALMKEVETEGLNRLSREVMISFGTICLYHTHASTVLQEAGIYVKDALELPSLEMIKKSVACGIGFALVPEVGVKKELDEGHFQVLPISPESYSMHGLIIHKNRELSYPAKLVKSELIKRVGQQ
ncbi:LysR family transcriptional regulator [Paenibacillus apiarius]|uniref:LysR family transcriptional regulator n=1 Tax=Paenibacillus apiarius TaxID=46240 RepID=A0ABT4E2S1_9BACL|nr:LysR family transcriptional regulator [Paenibacillus apiarius]MCY9517793.1 LysR family transcriptional regulator [Paenibacillus apiarius]MCY9523305.1 LysR family transcriptional regulator [Paenibacillus apiarius]MCY9553086.1 LysR family transcriptional regulator [Paenibacillus apiarius]MCY9561596.1 LysR family transcriptional regulator [Paenibacillus apiarius]MCY9687123.1 LysR family transcriptional regulator [Paenibacillus apiarius]